MESRITIDIAKLQSRKVQLEMELAQVDNMLRLVEEYSTPMSQPKSMLPVPPNVPVMAIQQPIRYEREKARGFTPGLRRAVTLALHTGPCTEKELTRALGWDSRRTMTVVSSMLKAHICYLSEHGQLALSPEGKTQAGWFLAHPEKLTYNPNGNGHKRANA